MQILEFITLNSQRLWRPASGPTLVPLTSIDSKFLLFYSILLRKSKKCTNALLTFLWILRKLSTQTSYTNLSTKNFPDTFYSRKSTPFDECSCPELYALFIFLLRRWSKSIDESKTFNLYLTYFVYFERAFKTKLEHPAAPSVAQIETKRRELYTLLLSTGKLIKAVDSSPNCRKWTTEKVFRATWVTHALSFCQTAKALTRRKP